MTIAEQVYERLKNAPPAMAQEVLDFLSELEAKNHTAVRSPRKMSEFAGMLKGSPSFEGDAVEIQRAMRAEWDRE